MFEWVFPSWTNPVLLILIVAARALVNTTLTVLVARSLRPIAGVTIVLAVLTILSLILSVLVLRGALGRNASYLEVALQVALIGLIGFVVYSNPSTTRVIVTIFLSICAIGLLVGMIPLYGEATVAP